MSKRKSNFKALAAASLLTFTLVLPAAVSAAPRIILNGQEINFSVKPTIVNDRTLVPIRGIFETLGAAITWDGQARTVKIERNGLVINMTIDDPTVYLNGAPFILDVAPQILEDRTFVPLRFISESLGAEVGWEGETQTVSIDYSEKSQQIVAKYQAEAQALKTTILASLNSLIDEAQKEYASLPEEEKATSKLAVYSKYLGRAINLQTECDNKFSDIMSRMSTELESNGFTQAAVDRAKAQYENEKAEMMKSLAAKAGL